MRHAFTLALGPALGLAMLIAVTGCGQGTHRPRPRPSGSPFPSVAPAAACTVYGSVKMTGAAPARSPIRMSGTAECAAMHDRGVPDETLVVSEGRVANAVVYIAKGLERYAFALPSAPAVLDQKGCMFVPHVLGVRAGQDLRVQNSDPTLHNVHASPRINEGFNRGLASQGSFATVGFDRTEVAIPVTCDVHSWMKAYVAVFDHPFYSVTPADGSYALSGLPAGHYTIGVWHERLGEQSRGIELAPGTRTAVDFSFQAPH